MDHAVNGRWPGPDPVVFGAPSQRPALPDIGAAIRDFVNGVLAEIGRALAPFLEYLRRVARVLAPIAARLLEERQARASAMHHAYRRRQRARRRRR